MPIPHDTLVVVADGRKMLFLRNEGDGEFPNLQVERVREQENPAHHDQATDTSGRAANTVGGRGGSFEEADFHQLAEDRFAAETAELMRKRALANEFQHLVVVAPPRTLGELRKHYHKEVERRIIAELDKDLTGHPATEIERIVSGAIDAA